jgi:hypothetical protein
MSQLPLLEVPKDAPSHKALIAAFKQRVGIWTHSAHGESSPGWPKWMAMLMPTDGAGKERYSDHRHYCKSDEPLEIIAGYCRIMDESGRTGYGHTEKESIRELCSKNEIPCEI